MAYNFYLKLAVNYCLAKYFFSFQFKVNMGSSHIMTMNSIKSLVVKHYNTGKSIEKILKHVFVSLLKIWSNVEPFFWCGSCCHNKQMNELTSKNIYFFFSNFVLYPFRICLIRIVLTRRPKTELWTSS